MVLLLLAILYLNYNAQLFIIHFKDDKEQGWLLAVSQGHPEEAASSEKQNQGNQADPAETGQLRAAGQEVRGEGAGHETSCAETLLARASVLGPAASAAQGLT